MKMKNTMLDDLNVVVLAGGDPALRRADIDSDCITNVRIFGGFVRDRFDV